MCLHSRIFLSAMVVLMVVLMMPGVVAAQTAGVTGKDLIDDCRGYPASPHPKICEAYAQSFAEFLRSNEKTINPKGRLCIGEDVGAGEIIADVNGWIAGHPDAAQMSAYDIFYDALKDRYRCN